MLPAYFTDDDGSCGTFALGIRRDPVSVAGVRGGRFPRPRGSTFMRNVAFRRRGYLKSGKGCQRARTAGAITQAVGSTGRLAKNKQKRQVNRSEWRMNTGGRQVGEIFI